jgi:RNAse (barnase) inhibitor barstar
MRSSFGRNKMKTITIDWTAISDEADFYASVLPQTGAPSWHGHNLDAIQDSWVTGDICAGGPPFNFAVRGSSKANLRDFSDIILEIAEESVKTHGGQITHEN